LNGEAHSKWNQRDIPGSKESINARERHQAVNEMTSRKKKGKGPKGAPEFCPTPEPKKTETYQGNTPDGGLNRGVDWRLLKIGGKI